MLVRCCLHSAEITLRAQRARECVRNFDLLQASFEDDGHAVRLLEIYLQDDVEFVQRSKDFFDANYIGPAPMGERNLHRNGRKGKPSQSICDMHKDFSSKCASVESHLGHYRKLRITRSQSPRKDIKDRTTGTRGEEVTAETPFIHARPQEHRGIRPGCAAVRLVTTNQTTRWHRQKNGKQSTEALEPSSAYPTPGRERALVAHMHAGCGPLRGARRAEFVSEAKTQFSSPFRSLDRSSLTLTPSAGKRSEDI
ncbi:hypothetical protein HPB49_014657 [Dermacentor silvarum]|uniref:Uncharacterized protein n=1 Tax=Dermacentor silvarum TaxID=543639 RepID=A0ACB8E0P0_DERSI|nr:hypothetical protein HPB49_014657 [Dermacentor silvarum]